MTKIKSPLVYTQQQRRLHWWVAAIVAVQYLMQEWLREAFARVASEPNVRLADFLLTNSHMLLGFAVAYLVFVRLRLRQLHAAERSESNAYRRVVTWVHRLIYAVLLGMVASGTLHYYAGWSKAADAHELGKWLLAALIGLHLAGALIHQWRSRTEKAGC